MIRKLSSGQYRLYSRKTDPRTKKRRNLGTFDTRAAAEKHEARRAVFQASLGVNEKKKRRRNDCPLLGRMVIEL